MSLPDRIQAGPSVSAGGSAQDVEIARFTEEFLRQQVAAGVPANRIGDFLMFRPGGSREPILHDLLGHAAGREWLQSHADQIRRSFLETCRPAPDLPEP